MKNETVKNIPISKSGLPVGGRDHIQGSIDAPSTLLEYGDYQCPYCRDVYPIVKAIQEQLDDRLCFAFRNFPLVNSHPYAEHAAEAAEAAGAQGKFWEMHDLLFENREALDDENLAGYAEVLDLDVDRFTAEVSTGAHKAWIQEDLKSGTRAGVDGTPCFFINGERYDGEHSFDELLAALNKK